jgi:hypothetical protein
VPRNTVGLSVPPLLDSSVVHQSVMDAAGDLAGYISRLETETQRAR